MGGILTKAGKLATEISTLSDIEKLHLLDSIHTDLDKCAVWTTTLS